MTSVGVDGSAGGLFDGAQPSVRVRVSVKIKSKDNSWRISSFFLGSIILGVEVDVTILACQGSIWECPLVGVASGAGVGYVCNQTVGRLITKARLRLE